MNFIYFLNYVFYQRIIHIMLILIKYKYIKTIIISISYLNKIID